MSIKRSKVEKLQLQVNEFQKQVKELKYSEFPKVSSS